MYKWKIIFYDAGRYVNSGDPANKRNDVYFSYILKNNKYCDNVIVSDQLLKITDFFLSNNCNIATLVDNSH
jgi:hypothetical protein